MDSWHVERENLRVIPARVSQRWIAQRLGAAYAGGLLSEETFVERLHQLLDPPLIDSRALIGDLNFRRRRRSRVAAITAYVRGLLSRLLKGVPGLEQTPLLLALDWSGETTELMIGRHNACEVVLSDATVSRQHARLLFRDGKWIIQDLRSTNGTLVNGTQIGRCELWPGDRVLLGEECLTID